MKVDFIVRNSQKYLQSEYSPNFRSSALKFAVVVKAEVLGEWTDWSFVLLLLFNSRLDNRYTYRKTMVIMPCTECGHLLCVDRDDHSLLFCPNCEELDLESEAGKEWRLSLLFNHRFTPARLTKIVESHGRTEAISALLSRIDKSSKKFINENRLPALDYGYISYIIKLIYENMESDNSVTDFAPEIEEEIDTIVEGHTWVIETLKGIEEKFIELEKVSSYPSLDPIDIVKENEYIKYRTEYDLCFNRCAKGIIGHTEENREAFYFASDHIRGVDRTDPDDIESLYDFGDCWYDVIISLAFISSFNELISSAYTTFLPDEVTIFQIQNFIQKLNNEVTSSPEIFDHLMVNNHGKEVFGKKWKEVKKYLIISEENTNAHPLLFEVDITKELNLRGGRKPYEKTDKMLLYPMYLAGFLKFQLFPLLNNDNQPSGHKLLEKLTKERGDTFERQLYEFLDGHTEDCYFSAELPGTDGKEIDVLYRRNDELVFIEAKYVTPILNMSEAEGIEKLNDKFNNIVFKETNDTYKKKPGGTPFHEKVAVWSDLDPGDTFRAENELDSRENFKFKEEWCDLNIRSFVVSNLVPSFTEKYGVQFLTDVELYKHIKHGENVFYQIK